MAAMSFLTQYMLKWLVNPLFWLLILCGIMLALGFFLYMRRQKRLIYPSAEFIDLGNEKPAVKFSKCGWFGKTSYLNGLWWSGKEVMKTLKNMEIRNFSTQDYVEINGKRGVAYYRDPVDQSIFVPIHKIKFENSELVAEIAPASFRDAATDIYRETIKETADWKEKILPYVAYAFLGIIVLICVIVVIKFADGTFTKVIDLINNAGPKGAENCKSLCREIVSVVKGSAV